ncbi:hypothetical protein JOM56_008136 [Amanita muscaria]
MVDDQTFYPSCKTVSEAASRTDLSSSTSMDLITTMSNLVIDEGPALEEGIANESAADNERTIREDSVAWQTAEETAPRDDSENAADEVVERFGEEGSEVTYSDHEESTEEDRFDSHYLSSLSSGNENSCFCSASVNLSVSSGTAGSGTETELLEDVGSLAVEELRWEYDEPESEEQEDRSGNGHQLLAADAEVNDEDQGLARHDLFEHGTETEWT